jgi:hypothetical protein
MDPVDVEVRLDPDMKVCDDEDPGGVLDDEGRPVGEEVEGHAGYTSLTEPFLGM